MTNDAPPPSLPVSSSRDIDDVDPELLALPDPPRGGRTLTLALLALTALASLAMVFALRRDVAYALHADAPVDVGDLRLADAATLAQHDNATVTAHAMLGAAGGIRYERPFAADSFRALPIAGRGDVWVEVRVPDGEESGRWEPPRAFTGRLVRFDEAGPRHRGLAAAIRETTSQSVPQGAWLLVDGEAPSSSRWSIALAALFLVFGGWNVVAMGRLVRKIS